VNGFLIFFLHAHLPYVRHPEYEYSLEENWLFEALWETYIPLLYSIERLADEGINPQITLSMSPPLIEMLNDELLKKRFVRHIENLIDLSASEIERTNGTPFEPVASMYHERFKQAKQLYIERYERDIASAFGRLQDKGLIEIAATAATHAFLPAFEKYPDAVKRQIHIGIETYIRNFKREPAGFWLPECGYFRGLDSFLKDAGIKYFFLESHGIIHGRPRPKCSVYKPVLSPSGLTVFGRDFKSARQVWCAWRGYPGDPHYRDFYRDIGFDLPLDYTGKFTHFRDIKTATGIKYHRVTGRTGDKLPYDRAAALERAEEHAGHFIRETASHLKRLSGFCDSPVIFSAFDAELFGHWWFEGVEWLEFVLRNIPGTFKTITPGGYLFKSLASNSDFEKINPAQSSWGEGGYGQLWIGKKSHRIYRHLHKTIERMRDLRIKTDPLLRRAVNQAEREALLSQASDWAFLIEKERAAEYAENRIMEHIGRFNELYSTTMSGATDEKPLRELEEADNIFQWL
jgi:1,4-alpha-glucan branching enzyme